MSNICTAPFMTLSTPLTKQEVCLIQVWYWGSLVIWPQFLQLQQTEEALLCHQDPWWAQAPSLLRT